ncbi:hypothetical protein WJX72_001062 [[Myrmecia] bisecta]|uniref:RNA-directed DNA polymerase n=1 Tax=[Myrmecia] bisecta TaxID=41462 RepID=A0AAW1P5T7_9CHLO
MPKSIEEAIEAAIYHENLANGFSGNLIGSSSARPFSKPAVNVTNPAVPTVFPKPPVPDQRRAFQGDSRLMPHPAPPAMSNPQVEELTKHLKQLTIALSETARTSRGGNYNNNHHNNNNNNNSNYQRGGPQRPPNNQNNRDKGSGHQEPPRREQPQQAQQASRRPAYKDDQALLTTFFPRDDNEEAQSQAEPSAPVNEIYVNDANMADAPIGRRPRNRVGFTAEDMRQNDVQREAARQPEAEETNANRPTRRMPARRMVDLPPKPPTADRPFDIISTIQNVKANINLGQLITEAPRRRQSAFINMTLARQAKLLDFIRESNTVYFSSAWDSLLPYGVIPRARVRVGTLTMPLDLQVTTADNYDMLLGNDWLQQAEASIDFKAKKLTFRLDRDHYDSVEIDMDPREHPMAVMMEQSRPPLTRLPNGMATRVIPPALPDPEPAPTKPYKPQFAVKELGDDDRPPTTCLPVRLQLDLLEQLQDPEDAALLYESLDPVAKVSANERRRIFQARRSGSRPVSIPAAPRAYDSLNPLDRVAAAISHCYVRQVTQRDTSDWQFSPRIFQAYNVQHGPFQAPIAAASKVKVNQDLEPEQHSAVQDVIAEFPALWADTVIPPGRRKDGVEHHIDTGDHRPIKQQPYRFSKAENDLIDKEVKRMLEEGVIHPSHSPWASPVVIVPKPDGTTRFCIDFRKLNAITKYDAYPLPRVDDALDALGGACWFRKLDLKAGYWQIPMAADSILKTSFVCRAGTFSWSVLPFGLSTAPATFQRLLDTVLSGLLNQICFVYLDDIIVFSATFEDHLRDLRKVFTALQQAELKANPKKCELAKREMTHLGHTITDTGIYPDEEKISTIAKAQPPRDVTHLRSFLGLASYYRKFIKGFSTIAAPLNRLLKRDTPFKWTRAQQIAFEELKRALTSPPILRRPDFTVPFILQTDWQRYAIGAVLSQRIDDKEYAIAYASRALSNAELNYAAHEGECLAVIWAVKHFRPYLYGTHFTLQTDHRGLQWLMNTRDLTGKLARWSLKLQEYDFTIEYRKGSKHGNADGVSHLIPQPQAAGTIASSPSGGSHSQPATANVGQSGSCRGAHPAAKLDDGELPPPATLYRRI